MICHNCSNTYTGHYCNQCGQKAGDKHYTIKGMLSDLFLSAVHVEKKGLPYTLKELTFNPGTSIRKVIDGQRLHLYPPFKYLVLMGAIVIVLSIRYKFFHNEYTQANNADGFLAGLLSAENLAYVEAFFKFAEDQATFLNIAAIPIFSLVSWSFISYKRFNLAENLIINTFITAHQLFFLILTVPFIEFLPQYKVQIIIAYSAVIMLYNIWVYMQIFEGRKFTLFFKSTLAVAISFLYQIPLNLLIYSVYHKFVEQNLHSVKGIIH